MGTIQDARMEAAEDGEAEVREGLAVDACGKLSFSYRLREPRSDML